MGPPSRKGLAVQKRGRKAEGLITPLGQGRAKEKKNRGMALKGN